MSLFCLIEQLEDSVMASRPTYEELEKRVQELEQKIQGLEGDGAQDQRRETQYRTIFDAAKDSFLINLVKPPAPLVRT